MVDEHAVVVRGDSPVLGMIVFVGEVLLVVGKERVQLHALPEVLNCLEASDVLQELKVTVNVNAGADQSVPVHALELYVRIVFLELEVNSFSEIDIWAFDGMHVFTSHLELVEVEVLWEDLHIYFKDYI